jgi:hypothetical protein
MFKRLSYLPVLHSIDSSGVPLLSGTIRKILLPYKTVRILHPIEHSLQMVGFNSVLNCAILSRTSDLSRIAPDGQTDSHEPHSTQLVSIIILFPLRGALLFQSPCPQTRAPYGLEIAAYPYAFTALDTLG